MAEHRGADRAQELIAGVALAYEQREALYINGGGSKRNLAGRNCPAPSLEVGAHRGILDYQSAELVLTARAGTTLREIVEVLDAENQVLGFDPPLLDDRATLGGTLATNLSGPARPWRGSVRDAVLGVQLINGKAELLNFGGKVMKNVAGYDVSRLQAGALGTLGVLTQVSLRVVPRPEHELSMAYEMSADEAISTMNQRAGEAKPLSGACWLDGTLYLRLSGAASAVEHTARQWGGEQYTQCEVWEALREMSLPFFQGDAPLWRLSLKPTAEPDIEQGSMLIDWGGAQRWLRANIDLERAHASAQRGGGHALLFRGGDREGHLRATPNAIERRLLQRLKRAFDPHGILNPGRLHADL